MSEPMNNQENVDAMVAVLCDHYVNEIYVANRAAINFVNHFGLNLQTAVLLRRIAANKGITVSQLTKETPFSMSVVSTQIGKLLKDDQVEMKTTADDRRTKLVFLTNKGVRLHHKIEKSIRESVESLGDTISIEKIDDAIKLIEQLGASLPTFE
ncbi:MarR family winged helix-turn-helix transcriptional regulator [Furfurilactobacillus milii]|uniref:HTH marR-type domain-containing protein n=1 Tax=Furfurilactobacillus rossiae TaxID=231049 RepID=A0A7C9ISB5_9LACO|nr:MarR family winged helix-turn-helix transcriptional regulator [Furfurilactobacillus milii]MYV05316.1 hypothetical protein [Furfurilactobacillus milii]